MLTGNKVCTEGIVITSHHGTHGNVMANQESGRHNFVEIKSCAVEKVDLEDICTTQDSVKMVIGEHPIGMHKL
jgi:hypothetical protein